MLQIVIGSLTMITAFIVSVRYYRELDPKWLQLFVWFTIVQILFQFGGYYYVILTGIRDNIFLYNINIFIEYGFYLFLFFKAVKGVWAKRITLVMLVGFTLLYLFEVFIKHPFVIQGSTYNSLMCNIGEFLTIIGCFIFLVELMLTDEYVHIVQIPMFWVTTGIMIQIVGIFMLMSFSDYITLHQLDPDGWLYGTITTVCCVIQYGLITIGLLARKIWAESKL
ncbi:hypothetical protein WG904_19015 [Pedobacter sp. Du54]|uniref:hypothetical protein n=1 Tax=Pedobacter anseongensis TaxID=3133439 RepID=UPI0030A38C3A